MRKVCGAYVELFRYRPRLFSAWHLLDLGIFYSEGGAVCLKCEKMLQFCFLGVIIQAERARVGKNCNGARFFAKWLSRLEIAIKAAIRL